MSANEQPTGPDPREDNLCPDCGRWSPCCKVCWRCIADYHADDKEE